MMHKYNEKHLAQCELAQKAIDIHKKELSTEKALVVNRLNQTWENFTNEQKAQLQPTGSVRLV